MPELVPSPGRSNHWASRWVAIPLLLALTTAAYLGSFSGVIEGDASALVAADSRVHAATPENLRLIATRTYWSSITSSTLYRPLVTLSWMVNYVGFGNREHAFGYHVFNLALHLINVILAWLVILRIWKDPLPAFLAAAVFAVHPVNTEAVTNIAGRADLMAALGVLAGLLLHITLPDQSGWRRKAALAGMFLAFCFGFLSKENAIVLPAAMLLYDVLLRRHWNSVWPAYVAVLAPIALILAWRHWVLPGLAENLFVVDNPLVAAGFWRARLTAIEVLWRYLGLLAWPQQLSWDYSYNQIPLATTAGGATALIAMLALLATLVGLYRRAAAVCFFGLFFFLTLAPTSNVFLLIGSIMAERFLYLPSIGFAVCVVATVVVVCRSVAPARSEWIAACVFVAALTALSARTWARNVEWTDGPKLWDSALNVSPNSFKTHLQRINGFYRRGLDLFTLDESIEEARKAVSIVADLPPEQSTVRPLETLASLYQLKGDTLANHQSAQLSSVSTLVSDTSESPREWYEKALEVYAQAVELDTLLRESGKRQALDRGIPKERIRFGGSSFLYSHLGDTYRSLGRFPEALKAFEHLSAIVPADPDVYEQIAQVERALRSTEDAILAIWKAETLRPRDVDEADLASMYSKLDPSGCAVVNGKPNQGCPLVREHLCRAEMELADQETESGLPDEAAGVRGRLKAMNCGAG